MKRKVLIGLVALMTLCGTAYAAVNGSYKGRDIVRTYVNGVEVKSTIPGQMIDGTTMLPMRAVVDAMGGTVKWDSINKRADITVAEKQAQGLTLDQLNKIGESVGLVYVLNASGQQIGTGSGFVTAGNVFVTNYHVAENASSLVIEFGNQSTTVKTSDALFSNPSVDLFAVTVEGKTSLKLNTGTPNNKDKVYTLGYPSKKFTITEGMFVSKWNNDRWVHSALTRAGSSGGILINGNGEVIGVTTAGNDSGINIAVRASILQEELNKLK